MPRMSLVRSLALCALILVPLAACAANPRADAGSRQSRDVITREQLADVTGGTVFDAVERYRPVWLRRAAWVYMNDMQMTGGIDVLHQVTVEQVQEVRWVSPERAASRWNLRTLTDGVIQIITRR